MIAYPCRGRARFRDKPTACSNAAYALRPGGRLIVSHPEGRTFVDQLRPSILAAANPTLENASTVVLAPNSV